MDIDFNKFSSKTWIALILIWITLISSGILFLFLYKNNLFTTLDIFKLILLSSSISTPIWLANCLVILISFQEYFRNDKGLVDFLLLAISAALFSIPVFYVPFLIKFFFHNSTIIGIIWILCLQVVLNGTIFVSGFLEKKYKKQNKKPLESL